MSVGAVIHKDAFKEQRKDLTVAAIYERAIVNCPILKRITSPGQLVSELRVEQDYSYTSDVFSARDFLWWATLRVFSIRSCRPGCTWRCTVA